MRVPPLDAGLATAVAFAAAGLLCGAAYFAVLRRAVALYCAGSGALQVGALTIGRLAAVLGFFTFVAHRGAGPLLAALAGFLISRTFAVRAARRHAA